MQESFVLYEDMNHHTGGKTERLRQPEGPAAVREETTSIGDELSTKVIPPVIKLKTTTTK